MSICFYGIGEDVHTICSFSGGCCSGFGLHPYERVHLATQRLAGMQCALKIVETWDIYDFLHDYMRSLTGASMIVYDAWSGPCLLTRARAASRGSLSSFCRLGLRGCRHRLGNPRHFQDISRRTCVGLSHLHAQQVSWSRWTALVRAITMLQMCGRCVALCSLYWRVGPWHTSAGTVVVTLRMS